MRNREQESDDLDNMIHNTFSPMTGQLFIGRCIKYLADTLYLIHKEQTERNEHD